MFRQPWWRHQNSKSKFNLLGKKAFGRKYNKSCIRACFTCICIYIQRLHAYVHLIRTQLYVKHTIYIHKHSYLLIHTCTYTHHQIVSCISIHMYTHINVYIHYSNYMYIQRYVQKDISICITCTSITSWITSKQTKIRRYLHVIQKKTE